MTGDPKIDRLDLAPDVAQKALALKRHAPGVVFLSGRRTLEQQAKAMAANTVRNRRYIAATYHNSHAVRLLQNWVDQHREVKSRAGIAAGLTRIMRELPEAELLSISRHLTGRAFDLEPHSAPVSAVEALEPDLFLQHEGSLLRWHVQFK